MDNKEAELRRIEGVYRDRFEADKGRYSLFEPDIHFFDTNFERDLIKALKSHGIGTLQGMKILEVGCGDGRRLRNLQRLGAEPSDLHGIELTDLLAKEAMRLSSNCHIVKGDASHMPYADSSFDMVYQRTVFTSVLDPAVKRDIALEMQRVLRPGGYVLWYDFFRDNPRNKDVKGVGREEIRKLFGGCDIELRKITLAPPIARALAPLSAILCEALELIPLLRTHYLGLFRKR